METLCTHPMTVCHRHKRNGHECFLDYPLKRGHKKPHASTRLTSPHAHSPDVLLPKEVPDLHKSSILLHHHINGEMGIDRAHLVPETLQETHWIYISEYQNLTRHLQNSYQFSLRGLQNRLPIIICKCWCIYNPTYQGHSLDHVLDMAADGADCGQLLPVSPPFVHTKLYHTSKRLFQVLGCWSISLSLY